MSYKIALDTTNGNISYALFYQNNVIFDIKKKTIKNTAEILAPIVQESLYDNSIKPKDISEIISVAGPGGFSGVRTGTSFVTGFSFISGTNIKTISSLEALALSVEKFDENSTFISVLNAKRDSVYIGFYNYDYTPLISERVCHIDDLEPLINEIELNHNIHISGHGYDIIKKHIDNNKIKTINDISDAFLFGSRSHMIKSNREHKPIYLREADAKKQKPIL